MDAGEGFWVELNYAENAYSEAAMERYLNLFRRVAQKLAKAADDPALTVSDVLNME